jgi:hypothetical protein
MRIARRSSGGRGEYEISEDFNDLTPPDLFDRAITLVLSPRWEFSTSTALRHQGGKRRLRLLDNSQIHLHRQLAAALLMPSPVRERAAFGDGMPVLRDMAYAIETIPLANVELRNGNTVRITVGEVLAENGDHHEEPIDYRGRLANIEFIWASIDDLPPELAELVAAHKELVTRGGPVSDEAEQIVSELQRVMTENADDYGTIIRQGSEDVVPDLLKVLRWRPPQPTVKVEDVAPPEVEIRRRVIKQWKRWANARGPESRRFKEAVRAAYNSTCIFCGIRLPRTPSLSSPGVDASHILPWADYDLDEVSNGLCCCKLHHWAFDEGLLVLRWDEAARRYIVEVPADLAGRVRSETPEFDIDELEQLAGQVPEHRLPRNPRDRPRPQCLQMLNDSQ